MKTLFFPLFHRDEANLKHGFHARVTAWTRAVRAPQQCPIAIVERDLHCLSAANPAHAGPASIRLHALLDEKFFS